MTQIPAVTDKNSLVADFINENNFDHFSLKFVNSNLHLDCSETHPELVSVMKIAGLCKRVNEKIDVVKIIEKMPAIAKVAKQEECWIARTFRGVIQTLHDISFPEVEARVRSGKVKFQELPFILKAGMNVIVAEDKQSFGGVLKRVKIVENYQGVFLQVSISVIIATSNGPVEAMRSVMLPAYEGIISASKLPIHEVTEEERVALTERGKIFNKFAHKPSLTAYKGILTIPSWFGDQLLRADGRIMIDTRTFGQMEPDLYRSMISHAFNFRDADTLEFEDDDGDTIDDEVGETLHEAINTDEEINNYTAPSSQNIPEKHLWRCYHRIPGFSMRLKIWGWVDVASLKDVEWRDDAFKNLVLPNKDRIFHLVKNYGASFNDFIDDKSGGLIFLLHGPTGQGKTLTAEAVAESLRRPLYSISMGELGTTVVAMEKKLRTILDLAHQWNAVLLLDEADIFMEARDTNDVERNAMVSIFLRILEYHSGVMFLTTNRVKAFDPAFFSRISMAIKYEPMTTVNRKAIWANLLNAAKIDHSTFDLDAMAAYEINGRNMKTAVRLGQTNALGYNRPVTQDDIEEVLKSASNFNHEIGIY